MRRIELKCLMHILMIKAHPMLKRVPHSTYSVEIVVCLLSRKRRRLLAAMRKPTALYCSSRINMKVSIRSMFPIRCPALGNVFSLRGVTLNCLRTRVIRILVGLNNNKNPSASNTRSPFIGSTELSGDICIAQKANMVQCSSWSPKK